jgi:hypothetical protein
MLHLNYHQKHIENKAKMLVYIFFKAFLDENFVKSHSGLISIF